MFSVLDMRATVRWYSARLHRGRSIRGRRRADVRQAVIRQMRVRVEARGHTGPRDVSLWFYTDRMQELYQRLKERQMRVARPRGGSRRDRSAVRGGSVRAVLRRAAVQHSRPQRALADLLQPDWLTSSSESSAAVGPARILGGSDMSRCLFLLLAFMVVIAPLRRRPRSRMRSLRSTATAGSTCITSPGRPRASGEVMVSQRLL